MKNFIIKIIIIFLILLPINSNARGISLIRDAEIEDFLYDLTNPIFTAAKLNPADIKIYIVNESGINAFVAGGQNVFINTGLIMRYSDPDVLIGVMAHETGHIASGHLARGSEDMSNAGNAMILSYIAGIVAAIAASPDAGMALIMGGSHIAERTALKFTRTQEEAADYLALKYLSATGNSPDGLLTILKFFQNEEKPYLDQIDEYALTHPISKKRIQFIEANSPKKLKNDNYKRNIDLKKRLARIVVKLDAFLSDPNQTLQKYSSNSKVDKYARSIAYYRKGLIDRSIKLVDELIEMNLDDGYLFDLKGQILAENGDEKNAIISYNQSIQLNPRNNLARIALANTIIILNSSDKEINNFAIENLLIASKTEKNDRGIYKSLAKIYRQNGDLGKSYLALAQMSLLEKDKEKTEKYIKLAKENLDENDKINLLILDDVEEFNKKIKDKDKI
ncbi:MAG: putative Zn-dependent protease [Rickettsiales bacterium]|jgi:predicted Zn-dependent protease